RGDVLSMRGVAREVALVLGNDLRPLDLSVPETGPPAEGLASVAVSGAAGRCPRRRGVPPVRPPGRPGPGRGPPGPAVDGPAAVPVRPAAARGGGRRHPTPAARPRAATAHPPPLP